MPCFGTKRTKSDIGRHVLEKIDTAAMYVERCTVQRRPYMYTGKRTTQMMYVMLYFCIECKLYEFHTYMIYIWTKNVSYLYVIVLYYRQKTVRVLKLVR